MTHAYACLHACRHVSCVYLPECLPECLPVLTSYVPADSTSLLGRNEHTIWFQAAAGLPAVDSESAAKVGKEGVQNDELAERLLARAEEMVRAEAQAFQGSMAQKSAADARWLQQVQRSGTTADRVAAVTLLVQVGVVVTLMVQVGGWVGA